eukprot:scaffold88187_cov35-Attheya_sp.AAC.1
MLKKAITFASGKMEEAYPKEDYGAEHNLFFAFQRNFLKQCVNGPKKKKGVRCDPEFSSSNVHVRLSSSSRQSNNRRNNTIEPIVDN